MNLNLPIFKNLDNCHNILIAGMGGGFDIFCGLPIFFELKNADKEVHLANFSFSEVSNFSKGLRLTETLVGVNSEYDDFIFNFPEVHLSRWFKEKMDEDVKIWCFQKTGTDPLLDNYKVLIEHLNIDSILLIDGGVDSLVTGDEAEVGTVIEDATSLFVLNELDELKTRLLCCAGFGAERDITYSQILENIAVLFAEGGFLGTCSLAPQMEVYKEYENAVLFVQEQDYQDVSIINSSIISAVQGHFGNYHLTEKSKGNKLWISPLMALYWFFDLPTVTKQNKFLETLRGTKTFMDAFKAFTLFASKLKRRSITKIPLT